MIREVRHALGKLPVPVEAAIYLVAGVVALALFAWGVWVTHGVLFVVTLAGIILGVAYWIVVDCIQDARATRAWDEERRKREAQGLYY